MTIGYTSAGMLTRWNYYAGRYTTDTMSNPDKYMFLADAEKYIITRLSAIDAKIFYGAPTQMTTADGGFTYTFGLFNSVPLFPMGRTQIFPNLNCLPGYALTPGIDYLDEGVRIRSSNNAPIPQPLYWYGLQPTDLLSDTVQPVLQPLQANVLTVIKAVADFAETDNIINGQLADRMNLRFEREFGPLCTLLRKHLRGSGAGTRLLSPWASAFGASVGSAASG